MSWPTLLCAFFALLNFGLFIRNAITDGNPGMLAISFGVAAYCTHAAVGGYALDKREKEQRESWEAYKRSRGL